MDMLKDRVRPLYLRLLAAAVGSAIVQSVFAIVDAMMVGQYHGPEGMSALAVFNPIWNIVYCLGILAGIGGSVLFANLRGAAKEAEAQQYFTLSVIYGAALSLAAMAGIALFNEPMLRLFGGDDTLIAMAQQYLKPIWFAIPCCVFSNILSAYLRNDGNAALAMKAVIAGGIFNVVGDYFFVFVLDMGIGGAGLATAIGLYVAEGIMLLHFFQKRNTLRLTKVQRPLYKLLRISTSGFPTAVSDLSMGVVTILFNRQIMRHLGPDALSVFGVISQIVPFVQCCAYGAGQAAQPILSQNFGARQFKRTNECLRCSLITCAVFGLAWLAAVEFFPTAFVYLFMEPTSQVLTIAPTIIRIYGLSLLLAPLNIFATYYFQSVMQPGISMVASLARGVFISGGLILLLPVVLGADSIWYAVVITEIAVALFSILFMRKFSAKFQ